MVRQIDTLSHFFLPLLVAYAIGFDTIPDHRLFLLAFLGIIADFDILFGIHRIGLHSPLLVIICLLPPIFLIKDQEKRHYLLLATYFLSSHIILDFFTGGVPVLWPFSPILVGIDFSFMLKVGSLSIEEFSIKLVFSRPIFTEHKEFSLIQAPGVITAFFYMLLMSKKFFLQGRERDDA